MKPRSLATAFAGAIATCAFAAAAAAQGLPPVPVPTENPVTEAKRILGKILFWDEQLSSDNSVACGTCHLPEHAGGDPREAQHPGADGLLGTADDVFGSPGVVRRDANGDTVDDPVFGYDPQVTGRGAPNFFGGLWAPENFWDGRASSTFVDPLDGVTVLIATGGTLESQAVGPILSSVEMAKDGRTWAEVTSKLAAATPLAFASDLPADLAAALTGGTTYGDLFQDAFGDPAITPARIAFAIATYERTLVADQTPWDLFIAGDPNAMTAPEQAGWSFFQNADCNVCHAPPVFSDESFRNVGVRAPAEDLGRFDVTANNADRGRFKVPTLRNVGLRAAYMHTGDLTTLAEVMNFYGPGQQASFDNIDPLMPVGMPPQAQLNIEAFMSTGLLDPRVAAATFPFDRPTLTAAGALPVPAAGASASAAAALAALLGIARLRRRQAPARGAANAA